MYMVPAELRYKLVQTKAFCPTEDMTKAIYLTFDEFQSSLSEKEVLHPSEECHRQRWLTSESKIFDTINSYHIFCRLCKKHFYSRSVPTDINSFFQVHINSEYHLEFRDSQFSRGNEMFTWEEKWRTGRCNVCQMSGLFAFVIDRNCSPKKLLNEHYCVWGFVMQENNEEFLRKMSLLKKYCQLSIFRDKFIRPLVEGSACLICCSKIPWSGENVKIHLGSPSHMNRFFWLVSNQLSLTLKDLLNGFHLEMVARWIYYFTVKPTNVFQPDYDKKRLECYLTSRGSLSFDFSPSSGHYCPNLIEDLLAYWPSDFLQGSMCLLCDQPTVDKHNFNNDHFKSEYHLSKSQNLSEESFGNLDRYRAFCANRDNRLRRHAETIEKYKQLKEGMHRLSLKVGLKNAEQTYVRKLFFKKLSLVKKPPSKFLNAEYICEICDLHISASLAVNHATEFVHLYYHKKWQELEKCAADSRFFDPFQKIRNHVVCLLCGVSDKSSQFFSHLKGTLHAKKFEWYCTLKNDVPISSAIEVKPDLSVVCYLCDSLLLKRMNKREFIINLRSLRKHWPCPSVTEQGEEAKESLKANKDRERTCTTCGYNQGEHESDCLTNSLNFKSIENAIKGTVDIYESAIFEMVLDKTKSTIRNIELAITADGIQGQEAPCEWEKSRSQCNCENLRGDSPEGEAVEENYQETEMDYLQNDNSGDEKIQEEKEQEISVIPGLRRPQKLESELMRFGKNHTPQHEGTSVKVMSVERGVPEEVSDDNLFPMNMTVQLRKISDKENEENDDAISGSLERRDLAFEKSRFPPLPSELMELLEHPSRLLEFVANLTAAATAASESVKELEREKLLCETINSAVLELFPRCRCYPFGSRLSGLTFSDSDLDVFLDCGGMYEGMENVSPWTERNLIHEVAKVLRKKREITKLITIGRARVPIISFLHKPTGIHCDLSFKNALSVHNTLLIKFLMSLDHRVKFIVIFFKYWVKQTGIHGPPFFSSYAITMMAIFYLQQLKPPMLPTVEELQNAFIGRRLTIGGWDCNFSENAEAFTKKGNSSPLHVILQGLFNYYANFDYVKFAISPLDGKPLPREAFSYGGLVKLPMCYKRHILNLPQPLEKLVCQRIPICVIDPFDLSHVLTKSFTPTGLQMFKHFCQLSAKALEKGAVISSDENKPDI